MGSGESLLERPKPRNRILLLTLVLVVSNVITVYYLFSFRPGHCSPVDLSLVLQLNATHAKLQHTERELSALKDQLKTIILAGAAGQPDPWRTKEELGEELVEYVSERKLPLGWSSGMASDVIVSPIGHSCMRQKKDLKKYMNYPVGGQCPDDTSLAHRLLVHGCEPLPRRRCFAATPPNFTHPQPLPDSLWSTPEDTSILWTDYSCKSFQCLRERPKKKVFEDCVDCFDLEGREKHRWVSSRQPYDFTIDEVLGMKQGGIRIGLDIGGGTGSFAVRMRERNVTIATTTLNLNGPFNNFVAMRGVLPLFLTVQQRLPFFDNTLDIVHSMHVLSNWIPTETLEFLLFDVDRVLRPGGILWLDRFFCVEGQLHELYMPLIERLGYTKLRWETGLKLDRHKEVYLSALLEKPIVRQA